MDAREQARRIIVECHGEGEGSPEGLIAAALTEAHAAGRRAGLVEARRVVSVDAAEMERRARNTSEQGLDRQTACAATAGRALREAAAGIAALAESRDA